MKRKVNEQNEFGFYLGNGDCYIVNPHDFKCFKLHKESTLLTHTFDNTVSRFTYAQLPDKFLSIRIQFIFE